MRRRSAGAAGGPGFEDEDVVRAGAEVAGVGMREEGGDAARGQSRRRDGGGCGIRRRWRYLGRDPGAMLFLESIEWCCMISIVSGNFPFLLFFVPLGRCERQREP